MNSQLFSKIYSVLRFEMGPHVKRAGFARKGLATNVTLSLHVGQTRHVLPHGSLFPGLASRPTANEYITTTAAMTTTVRSKT